MKNKINPNSLFLIDGSSFLYRAYYSMKPLHSPDGEPVQAVYGFCRMLKKLIDQFEPKNMVLVWDSKGKTQRHEIFSDYKATRQAAPSDLGQQKDLIKEFAKEINLAQVEVQGVEADDLIYSLTKDFSDKLDVVIVSSDKDLYQLLDEKVLVFDAFKDILVDKKSHEEKLGYSINKLPFYFSLLGDASDNIPGVRGIGQKGATDLVKEFNSLNDLYENLDKVQKPRTKQALIDNKDNAFLSLDLFLLRYTKIDLTSSDFKFDENNWNNAKDLFEKLNFKTLLNTEEKKTKKNNSVETKIPFSSIKGYKFKTVKTELELNNLINYLQEKGEFALDTETTGIDPLSDNLVGLSFCAEQGLAFYIPVDHQEKTELSKEKILSDVKKLLEDEKYKKILHNAKFDALVLSKENINVKNIYFDTIIAANLVANEWQKINLAQLSKDYLKDEMLTYEDVVKNNKYTNFSYVPLGLATQYAAADAHQTLMLKNILEKEIKEKNLENLFYNIEMPLMDVLTSIEKTGIYLEKEELKELDKSLEIELANIEEKIKALLNEEIILNLNSPKQVEDLLFNKLNLPPQKKSSKKTGYSTDQEVLQALSYLHPIPGLILKHRELYKLKSTYIGNLPKYINKIDKKVHTSFSQISTSTGRLSSFEPNLQNIPASSSDYAQKLRGAFKPEEGHVFISADYSQIELRVLAYLSKDKNLEKSFTSDLDIHAITAAKIFEVELENVTHEQRQVGKRINFSILYGLTPYGLSKDLNISFSDAKNYIEKYFNQYPEVKNWMEKVVEQTKEKGFVETVWGRRRYISGIYDKNKTVYEFAKRAAINTVAQGTASEIMKHGMIKIQKELLDAKIILQIHDELLISAPKEKAQEIEQIIKTSLEKIVDWNIPLKVATRIGKNWQEVSK